MGKNKEVGALIWIDEYGTDGNREGWQLNRYMTENESLSRVVYRSSQASNRIWCEYFLLCRTLLHFIHPFFTKCIRITPTCGPTHTHTTASWRSSRKKLTHDYPPPPRHTPFPLCWAIIQSRRLVSHCERVKVGYREKRVSPTRGVVSLSPVRNQPEWFPSIQFRLIWLCLILGREHTWSFYRPSNTLKSTW